MICASKLCNVLDSTRFSHFFHGEVCMAPRSIPITCFNRFRIKTNLHSVLFTNSLQYVTANPQLVTGSDASGGTNLVFPLARHHFSVRPTNIKASIEAGTIVCFNQITTIRLTCTDTTVIGAYSESRLQLMLMRISRSCAYLVDLGTHSSAIQTASRLDPTECILVPIRIAASDQR